MHSHLLLLLLLFLLLLLLLLRLLPSHIAFHKSVAHVLSNHATLLPTPPMRHLRKFIPKLALKLGHSSKPEKPTSSNQSLSIPQLQTSHHIHFLAKWSLHQLPLSLSLCKLPSIHESSQHHVSYHFIQTNSTSSKNKKKSTQILT
ncbi:hypothetical protein KC19_12G176400 [Ceratodon purpureus]|uniref:Uncharacterized protein n=1 Tax=Ceratodon purpureus TaxID=3225 RepID=A0A8T0GCH6_CERPU|nr:hypothetical protein KC19_12G176400 [Ceratodon purpureus]